ncbi:MAG TPA: hypothetical protein VI316_05845 [Candidatus Dormibacteraeota bacterium]
MTRHARTVRTVRTVAALGMLAWFLAACGASATAGSVAGGPTPSTASTPPQSASLPPVAPLAPTSDAAPAPTPAPSAVPSAVATPSLAPALVTPAPVVRTPAPTPPPPPASTARIVAILPLVAGGASGSVTEVTGAGGRRLQITVQGLAPGSVHAIHDHLGSCGGANASQHLTVLAIATADSAGMIRITVPVSSFLFGAGRIVIVYQTASPKLITGCADL